MIAPTSRRAENRGADRPPPALWAEATNARKYDLPVTRGASTDLYRANEVRSILAPLAALAERHACAFLAVRHLNKAKPGRSIYPGQGSIDFTAAARSMLLAGSAPDDPPPPRSRPHQIEPRRPRSRLRLPPRSRRLCLDRPSRLTAADLLAAESRAEDLGAEDEACAFLREALRDGPCTAAGLQ
jgi:putative DNA primase/helicase